MTYALAVEFGPGRIGAVESTTGLDEALARRTSERSAVMSAIQGQVPSSQTPIYGQRATVRTLLWTCWKIALLTLFLLSLAGCSPARGKVTGTVTYKGEPVRAGFVAFFGAKDQVASAPIASDGTFKASDVPLGEVKVTVSTPAPGPTKEQAAKNPMMTKKHFVPSGERNVKVPNRYSTPATSGISFTVGQGDQSINIDLK
jgi:hypothetical protein